MSIPPVADKSRNWQRVLAFIFGLTFLSAIFVMAILFPNPTPFQYSVFRIIISLASAGIIAMIPGIFSLQISTYLRGGGSLAVFILVFFFNPADLVSNVSQQNPIIKEKSVVPSVDSSFANISFKVVEFNGEAIDYLIDSNALISVWNEWFTKPPLIALTGTSIYSTLVNLKNDFYISIPTDKDGSDAGYMYASYDNNARRIKKLKYFPYTLAGTNPNLSEKFIFSTTWRRAINDFGFSRKCLKEFQKQLEKKKNTDDEMSDESENQIVCKSTLTRGGLNLLASFQDDITFVSQSGRNNYTQTYLALYDLVCKYDVPADFITLTAVTVESCGGIDTDLNNAIDISFTTPVLKVGVLAVKNNNNKSVKLDKLLFAKYLSDSLRSFKSKSLPVFEPLFVNKQITLDSGQTILFPAYISFTPLSTYKDFYDPIPIHEWTSLRSGYIFGPNYILDSVTVNNYRFRPLDNIGKNPLSIAYRGFSYDEGSASCPFIYTYSNEKKNFVPEGTIIYKNINKQRESTDTLAIKNYKGIIEIREIEPEISYIDEIKLLLRNKNTRESKVVNLSDKLLVAKDNNYLRLSKGMTYKIQFEVNDETAQKYDEAFLVSYGYYDPLVREKVSVKKK